MTELPRRTDIPELQRQLKDDKARDLLLQAITDGMKSQYVMASPVLVQELREKGYNVEAHNQHWSKVSW
jgi:hypothetical protein